MTNEDGLAMHVDIISDTVCPWCYVGKRRFDKALALRPNVDVEVVWRPFQLNPDVPLEGWDYRDYYRQKFGGEEAVRDIVTRIGVAGRSEGIDFAFDRIEKSPNTLASHRLIRWALTGGKQNEAVDAIFRAYFEEARDIGDHAVLSEIAAGLGMDAALVRELLDEGRDEELISQEIATAQQIGVRGVPTFIFDQKVVVSGAQETSTFTEVIDAMLMEAAGQVQVN